jgi:hypothetical protein
MEFANASPRTFAENPAGAMYFRQTRARSCTQYSRFMIFYQ